MISYFSFYKPAFMIQLLLAEFLFMHRFPKRKYFIYRYIGMIVLSMIFSIFIPIVPKDALTLSLTFLLLYSITFILNIFCFKVSISNILFATSIAYVIQHFAYCLSNVALLVSGLNSNIYGVYTQEIVSQGDRFQEVFGYIFSFVIFYLSYYAFYLGFGRRIKKNEEVTIKSIPVFIISIVSIIVVILFNALVIYTSKDKNIIVLINLFDALCCFFIIYSLFATTGRSRMKKELIKIQDILKKEEKQYEMTKDVIEQVNIKCHDLKHQIRALEDGKAISPNALNDAKSVLKEYESFVNTGNKPLDVILTEKIAYAENHNIVISLIADGKLLSFMNDSDVYSLFGNALDNATRAVEELEEKDRREITVKIIKVQSFIAINISNYCKNSSNTFKDGLPITSKSDKKNHGYGLKSIKYIVEKYNGQLKIDVKDDLFQLKILFTS